MQARRPVFENNAPTWQGADLNGAELNDSELGDILTLDVGVSRDRTHIVGA